MSFDFKKEYKEFYLPKQQPQTVCIPKMNFIAVKGKGDPNQENGEYKQALEALYTIAYTIKMSYKGEHKIDGFISMWYRRLKDCGGRKVFAEWIIHEKINCALFQ